MRPVAPADAVVWARTRPRRVSPGQALTIVRARLLWDRRAESWDEVGSIGLRSVVDAVLARCRPLEPDVAVDLGSGSGQVTLPLAPACGRILAVDISVPHLRLLEEKARAAGITNIGTWRRAIERLDLESGSVDLVVSNYALHHLRDADKADLVARSYQWLRPGGRLVIGDMMFGRGLGSGDRAIIRTKARAMLRRGPAGWWRLARNALRFGLRIGEKPLPTQRWQSIVGDAGFTDVAVAHVVAEACVLTATKPAAGEPPRPRPLVRCGRVD